MIGRLFYLMIVGVLLFTVDGLGQNTWVKTFGGSGDDWGYSITTTLDGGYVLTGYTSSNDGDFYGMNKGYGDIFVMKLNHNGDIVWKKTFGGSDLEIGTSITTTSDGGYVLTGFTLSNDGDFYGMNNGSYDIFVLKLYSNGDIVWKKTFGGSIDDRGRSITTTKNGGFVLTGETNSNDGDFNGMNKGDYDIFVHKLNSSGDMVWKKTFGGSSWDNGNSITSTPDNGFVFTGETNSNDGDFNGLSKGDDVYDYDIFVMKLNQNGDTIWKNKYGGCHLESVNSISTTLNGTLLLLGEITNLCQNDGDFIEMKDRILSFMILNSLGDFRERRSITRLQESENINSYILISNGSIVTGYISNNSDLVQMKNKGGDDILVMKFHEK